MRKSDGISLIALIITIIIMIILAGITINLLLGENGVIEKAKYAKFVTEYRAIEEGVTLYKAEKAMDEQSEGTSYTKLQKYPVTGALTSEEKNYIKTNIPTLNTKIEETTKKTIENVNLYWIDKTLINKIEQKDHYIIDVDTNKVFDYEGQLSARVRYHVLDKIKQNSNPNGDDDGDGDGDGDGDNERIISLNMDWNIDYGWKICNETLPIEVDKGYASKNYHIANSKSSARTYILKSTGEGTLSFDWQVSSEENNDYLYYTLYKDGQAVEGTGISTKISGNQTWENYSDIIWDHKEIPISEAGNYYLEVKYIKNSTIDSGLDSGFIKNLMLKGNILETREKSLIDNEVSVGDFVNYDAGIWSELPTTAGKTTSLSLAGDGCFFTGGETFPNNGFIFGGFKNGMSRNVSIKHASDRYIDNDVGCYYEGGWRVLSVDRETNVVKLVSAGTPETYYHTDGEQTGWTSSYILTGGIDYPTYARGYCPRDWSMYKNNTYALEAHCMTYEEADNITKQDLKFIGVFYYLSTIENSIKNNNIYSDCLYAVQAQTPPSGVSGYYLDHYHRYGLRVVVTLKPGTLFETSKGTDGFGNICWMLK